jgi:hypothetical protein
MDQSWCCRRPAHTAAPTIRAWLGETTEKSNAGAVGKNSPASQAMPTPRVASPRLAKPKSQVTRYPHADSCLVLVYIEPP